MEETLNCPDWRCLGHLLDARAYARMGMKVVTIVREPVARFLSLYMFTKFGSEDQGEHNDQASESEYVQNAASGFCKIWTFLV